MDQHFDAERLAAFADGSLAREERAAAEAHAADCPRCLHLLAAMARTDEPRTARRGFWSMPVILRWSVPFLAGATVLALWMNVRSRPAMEAPVDSVASHDSVADSPAPPPAASSQDKQDETAMRFQARPAEKRNATQPDAKARVEDSSARTEGRRARATPSAAEAAPVLAPLSDRDLQQLPGPTAPKPVVPVGSAAPSIAPSPNAAPVGAPTGQPSARFDRQEALAETVAVTPDPFSTLFEIASPDTSTRWRIAGKTIARSVDAGKTWRAERVPVQGEITAGSSPSPLVAWFVGRRGYILLTTGTNQWRRVIFPESTDLVDVSARSEREADITTSDGRVFGTTDAGKTWTPR